MSLPKTILEKDFGLVGKLIILDEGNGYFLRAIRTLVGTALIVVVDWQHPNYGYFSDGMVFIKTPHMEDWEIVQIVAWSVKYETVEDFLKDYPMLEELFEDGVSDIMEVLFSMAGD